MRHHALVAPSIVALAFAAVAACGPATTATPPKPPPVSSGPKLAEPISPARWVIQSGKVERVGVRLDLGPGTALYVGPGGERWLEHDGKLDAAATLLAEPIAAATRAADGKGVLFATIDGAVFEAPDPLAAVGPRKAPPTPLHAVAAGRASIVGVNAAGALLRTADAGASWKETPLAGARGTLVRVALGEAGAGLALFAPQRLYATGDDGATWQPLATPGIGAADVVRDVNGDVVLAGLEAAAVLRLGPLRLERVSRSPKVGAYEIANPTARPLGLAAAVAKGNGALVDDRYLEIVPDGEAAAAGAKDRWSLAAGPLGGAIETKRINALDGCTHVAIAAREKVVVALCTAPQTPAGATSYGGAKPYYPGAGYDNSPRLRVVRSEDAGATWKEDATIKAESGEPAHVWLAPDGAMILDGGCKPAKTACYDRQLLVHKPGEKAFAHVGTPRNWPKLRALAWSADGKKAFALGSGSGGVALLVSRDAGRDFSYVSLPSVPLEDEKAPAMVGSRIAAGSLSVDEKGVVYAAVRAGDRWAIFTSGDDGATVKGKLLPFHADALELVGRRGLAYARDGHAWETADGGATWAALTAPRGTGDAQLACDAYGCLVGDRATRVGWGSSGAPATTGAGPEAPVGKPKAAPTSVAAYRCKSAGEWLSIGRAVATPTAYDAEIVEGARWMAVRQEPSKGTVAVVVARPKAKGDGLELKETPLFATSSKDQAIAALPQIEGAAAIRFSVKRLPVAKGETVGAIATNQNVDVEVVWWLAATGQVKRATLRGVGPLEPLDVAYLGKDSSMLANLDLLSIAQGGVHVRPFASHTDAPLYFASDAGKVEKLAFPTVPTKDAGGDALGLRLDALRVGGRSVLIGIGEPGVQLFAAWANEAGNAWETHTWGLWPGGAGDATFDFTYLGGRPSIVALHTGSSAATSAGYGVNLEPKDDPGEPVAVPTQASLGAMPRACGGAQTSPRIVAPYAKGTRHPVVIAGEATEVVLATTGALIQGKGGDDACVRAWEAQPLAWGSGTRHGALVSADDLAHSTLFKIDGEVLSAKSMSCTLESGPLPASLVDAEGFGG
jgi:photosystem II stability/assembly factor-like uncharacterized protein